MNHPYTPEKIFIEKPVQDSSITQNVLARLPKTPAELIDSTEELLEHSKRWTPTIPRAKKHLILAQHKGRFFKPCPGRSARQGVQNACCNYFVINYASNCHMECSYCYLQTYLNFPYLIVYANVDDLLSELKAVLAAAPQDFFRVGTGELADSLALDPLTAYSLPLVRFFAHQENAVLELKTKSDCVDNLLQLEHGGRTVVSWSINPRYVQEQEEHKTATVEERLRAAERCTRAGYPVAFHLDPIIHYAGWERDYRELVVEIFTRIPPSSVAWISLGSLRMTPSLKELIRHRFPRSFLPLGELVPCEDGKLRYFKPIRVEMYQKILSWIRAASPRTSVYTCMERAEVWAKVFSTPPPDERAVGAYVTAGLRGQEPLLTKSSIKGATSTRENFEQWVGITF